MVPRSYWDLVLSFYGKKSEFSLQVGMEEEEILCPLCEKPFQTAWRVIRHAQSIHINEDPSQYICNLGGCEGKYSLLLRPLEIVEHHVSHFRFRRQEDSDGEEDEEDEGNDLEENLAPEIQYDDWFLDNIDEM